MPCGLSIRKVTFKKLSTLLRDPIWLFEKMNISDPKRFRKRRNLYEKTKILFASCFISLYT
jgi:hypothetical protein